ncbi:MAG: D-alanine--D-alanine ligase [Thermoleophilia bacterium]|nr:D-alanine--D-alanine ligase [Thermoleophilia bacterium]
MPDPGLKNSLVGVLMGGLSREREISLRSGRNCVAALESLGYNAVSIDVDRDIADTLRAQGIQVAFLALHGKFGEDGVMQGILELLEIPYTGSRVLASALGMNKVATKQIAAWHGIPTPAFATFRCGEDLGKACAGACAELGFPLMVKPFEEGSSLGVAKVDRPGQLEEVVRATCLDFNEVMAEEFVSGDEITVGLLETESELMALPVLQLKPKAAFYDFHAKYNHGMTEFILPADLPDDVAALSQERARQVFRAIGCRGFARVDFIVDSEGNPWLTEINTLPGMTDTSDLPAQAQAAGISYEELVDIMLRSALL